MTFHRLYSLLADFSLVRFTIDDLLNFTITIHDLMVFTIDVHYYGSLSLLFTIYGSVLFPIFLYKFSAFIQHVLKDLVCSLNNYLMNSPTLC
jgi:hypothetical protein